MLLFQTSPSVAEKKRLNAEDDAFPFGYGESGGCLCAFHFERVPEIKGLIIIDIIVPAW